MFTGQVPGVSGMLSRYVAFDNADSRLGESEIRILDMATGEVVLTAARGDVELVIASPGGDTVLLLASDGNPIALPDATVGGWVPGDGP